MRQTHTVQQHRGQQYLTVSALFRSVDRILIAIHTPSTTLATSTGWDSTLEGRT